MHGSSHEGMVFSREQSFTFPTLISVKQRVEGIASALPLCGVGWSKDCFYACLDEMRGFILWFPSRYMLFRQCVNMKVYVVRYLFVVQQVVLQLFGRIEHLGTWAIE